MIGNPYFDQLVASAPVNFDRASPDWSGIRDLLQEHGVDPASVTAVTWCSFGVRNIEALIDGPALTMVHTTGVLASLGKRTMFGKALKFNEIAFGMCRSIDEAEYADPRGLGKYCIEFSGPGGVLIGRLQWAWHAKRFGDSRAQIMAVAAERDRIMAAVERLTA